MEREIITINEEKCNGCGQCIPGCPEGALQVIDGKARLVSDLFCDGLGACIGHCPTGAMKVERREAEAYDEYKAMENVVKGGENVIKAHLKHLADHGENGYLSQAIDFLEQNSIEIPDYKEKTQCNCPSAMAKRINRSPEAANENIVLQPELNNWPIQLALVNPDLEYFHNADLVIAADCVPFSYANFHSRFLKNKILLIFCPKLDNNIDTYIQKLTHIFETKNIKSITIVHMEVPCCSGVEIVVKRALENAKKIVTIKDYTISISGELI